jgi:hypothetical protein
MKETVIAMKDLFPNDHAPDRPATWMFLRRSRTGLGLGLEEAGDNHRHDDPNEKEGDTAAPPTVGLLNILCKIGLCFFSFDQE